jgi:hypothetical protein
MQNPNRYGETLKQHIVTAGIISAVGALAAGALKLDQYLGNHVYTEDTEAEPEMVSHHDPDNDQTLVLLGGLCMRTDKVAKRCKSQLAHGVNFIAPILPDTGFNPPITHEKTWQEVERSNPKKILLAGISMGGPQGWDWLDYGLKTGRQDLVEKVTDWGMIGSPMDKSAVRPGPRALVNMVDRLGYSYILNHSRPMLRRWDLKSIANAPSTKIVPQCKYLAGKHAGQLPVMPKHVVYVRGIFPDPVVNEDRSIKILEQKLGFKVEQVVNDDWTHREHAPTDKASLWFLLSQLGVAKPNQPAVLLEQPDPFLLEVGRTALAA